MALLIGFFLVTLVGVFHHFALRGLQMLSPNPEARPNRAIITVFVGLLFVHLAEILGFAAMYRLLLTGPWLGRLEDFDTSWTGLIYFSGINFATLGYTQIKTEGPIRLVNMMQSLGGFMILTWSATFIYSVWKRALDRG